MQAFAATWGSDGVLYLEGEFDLDAEEAAVGALRGHPYDENGVVIDVSRLTFMDSTGIRVLQTLAQGPGATRVVLRSPRRGVQSSSSSWASRSGPRSPGRGRAGFS